ncbi:MAG: alpha/beta hydrolase [Bacteroidota bacterium]
MKTVLHHEIHFHSPQAKWVVFIHGAGGSIRTWTRQIEEFGAAFNLLLIDLRDHGQSKNITPAFSKYSFKVIAQDIKRVLDEQSIHRAHFVTLSFGSVVLQDFAFRYPSQIDRVIVVGGIFNGGLMLRSFVYLARLFNLFLSYPTMYRLFSYLLMPRRRNQFSRRLYQSQALKITPKEYMKWLGLYREFFQLLKQFFHQNVPVHTLVVMGSMDYVFLKHARRFAHAHRDRVQLQELQGAGHIANIEQSVAFNKAGMSFLQSEAN